MSKVSVIIPTHNRCHLLPDAVKSARQAGSDVEIIVVDDASTDNTSEVCQSLEGIHYIRLERNQHTAGARNIGLLASSAKYIAFLDDDDIRLPGSLDLQIKALEANPEAGMIYSQVMLCDQEGKTGEATQPATFPEGDIFWELLGHDLVILLQAAVIRKECFFRVGLLHDRLPGIEDWDIAVRIAELYPVIALKQPVTVYRESVPSSKQSTSSPNVLCTMAVQHQKRLLTLPRAAAASAEKRQDARQRLLRKMSQSLIWNAATHLPTGAREYARANLLAALRLNPLGSCRLGVFKLLLLSCLPQLRNTTPNL